MNHGYLSTLPITLVFTLLFSVTVAWTIVWTVAVKCDSLDEERREPISYGLPAHLKENPRLRKYKKGECARAGEYPLV